MRKDSDEKVDRSRLALLGALSAGAATGGCGETAGLTPEQWESLFVRDPTRDGGENFSDS